VFQNKLQYRRLNACINSGDDGATSCKNFVNFCVVTPDTTGLISIPMYVPVFGENRPTDLRLLHFHSEKPFDASGHINSGDDHAMPDINLVGF